VRGLRAPAPAYISVNEEDFRTVFARMSAAKAAVMKRQMDLLDARYDLGDRPAAGATMSRGSQSRMASASGSPLESPGKRWER
jgi:hypothetical protein